ncbi:hypothetical protein PVK06_042353 [Gossypium arboreum]|uniref:Uncharacterized protein n=1 Tax=Gossypium arboreum TaxID=29729 RepID=A0ABR0ML07_GOSAR|nr:hypothetical protein PVK06_042353 [Gossypium arboreum]
MAETVKTSNTGEGNSQESSVEFSKEEIEKLKNLLGSLEKSPSIGTSGLVFSEDKDREFFLLDIPATVQQPNTHIPAPVQQPNTHIPAPVQQPNTHIPALVQQPEIEPNTPKSQRGIQDTTRPLLVYSRKKAPVQVQSSSSPIQPETASLELVCFLV